MNLTTNINNEQVVTLDTIVKFSDNQEKSVQKLVTTHRLKLESLRKVSVSREKLNLSADFKFPEHISGTNKGKLNWSKVNFTEPQTTFLLSLMENTSQIVQFKYDLTVEFSRKDIPKLTGDTQFDALLMSMQELASQKIQITATNNKVVDIEQKAEIVKEEVNELKEITQRYGCPVDYISLNRFKSSYIKLAMSDIKLKQVINFFKVDSLKYTHIHKLMTSYVTAYKEVELVNAVEKLINESEQLTKAYCFHKESSIKFKYVKGNIHE